MSARAYILIETAVDKTRDVVVALKRLEGAKSVDLVTGPYDVIMVAEGDSPNALGQLVSGKIHHIVGVSRTLMCLAI